MTHRSLFCAAALGCSALFSPLVSAAENEVTAPDRLNIAEGFKVERLYSVPKDEFGSWVTLCKDDKGRLIAGDQYGAIYRFNAPAPGSTLKDSDIQKIDLDIGHAWGMCYAFDALYVVVNDKSHGGRGLYRVKDTNGDDQFDEVKLLKKFEENGGEHGPHAVIPSPDGKSLYIACGNQTELPEYNTSRVSEVWGEDNLLPRVYGRGFMKGTLAPRGWVCKTDPDGKTWDVIATGFRNQYDIDFNGDGELFTYDADMEWDLNTPWYRPTRVNHVISGAEFGWRNGSAKWPDYYSDSFGAVTDIGPGSPTGVVFGTGAKFPAKYQKAFFIADWSYGKLYAVHLKPNGASYTADVEEFIAGQPLALTDLTVGNDGALYFAVGGRRVQSGLYRVTYTGSESTAPVDGKNPGQDIRDQRLALEAYHLKKDPAAVAAAWPHLASSDRALRFAARTALEKQPVDQWAEKVIAEENQVAQLGAIMSLARIGTEKHQAASLAELGQYDYEKLDLQTRFDLLRAYTLVFKRLGAPADAQRKQIATQLDTHFPANNRAENIELSNILVYLGAEKIIDRAVDQLEKGPTQEEQIAMAVVLRNLKTGWNPDLQKRYFSWFTRAANYKGGAGFGAFIKEIQDTAVANLSPADQKTLKPILNAKPENSGPVFTAKPRGFVKNWTMEDLKPLLASGLEGERNFKNGREMFGAANCYACHRFGQEGGAIGPDLTSAAGKFSPHDFIEQIIEPGKEISDQYGSMVFTKKDGSVIIGRLGNLNGDNYMIITNLYAPGEMTSVNRSDLKSVEPSTISMMPPGLLNTLSDNDILDLTAYVLSAGDPKHQMFAK
ncbi:MAG: c-type cytochrome [Akkermansiaceae bacterium]|jgi:putative heme-binding domain-containing protein